MLADRASLGCCHMTSPIMEVVPRSQQGTFSKRLRVFDVRTETVRRRPNIVPTDRKHRLLQTAAEGC